MAYNYWDNFPISPALLPARLQSLLKPIGMSPQEHVEITTLYEHDKYGPAYEYAHMLMAVVPDNTQDPLSVFRCSSDGTVAYGTSSGDEKGFARDFSPSMDGYEYLVASWGNGSWYSYNLAEKVWMALGLSPRCIGNEHQTMVYDDLSLPKFDVAKGVISSEHYWKTLRNIKWTMSNAYLRKYLRMRGARGVRTFFYEAVIEECTELRKFMGGEIHRVLEPDNGWYCFDIREHHQYHNKFLIQIWATVNSVSCELCAEQKADELEWPDITGKMTHIRAKSLLPYLDFVVLNDKFLEKYEQNDVFDCIPYKSGNSWMCSPSYKGQWSFTHCERIGRNLIRIPIRELYKGVSDGEIVHAHKFSLAQDDIRYFDLNEEHIVSKVDRFVNQLLDMGDNLSCLGRVVGIQKEAEEIVKLSRVRIKEERWRDYPQIKCLAQIAPVDMTQQGFLARCKSLHELFQNIPAAFLKDILEKAGCDHEKVTQLRNLKLLEKLLNIIDDLNSREESHDNFVGAACYMDWEKRNQKISALFINKDLRDMDAHNGKSEIILPRLLSLGFDTARINSGYGYALDFVMDKVIVAFESINVSIHTFLER